MADRITFAQHLLDSDNVRPAIFAQCKKVNADDAVTTFEATSNAPKTVGRLRVQYRDGTEIRHLYVGNPVARLVQHYHTGARSTKDRDTAIRQLADAATLTQDEISQLMSVSQALVSKVLHTR